MKKIITFLSIILIAPAHTAASAENVQMLKVSRLGDTELSCGQLSQEATLMRDIIATTQDIKDDKDLNEKGIGVAGALGGLIIGSATGGIGLAAAGFLANQINDEEKEKVDSVQDLAAQRRILMMGIFSAKGCMGPIEHALHIPKPMNIKEAPEEVAEHLAHIKPAGGESKYYRDLRRRYND